jgi:hypothetical protein
MFSRQEELWQYSQPISFNRVLIEISQDIK